MLEHDEVWSAIDGLAERNGLSPSALARRAGLDPTTFNRSKRFAPGGRPRWPSTESIAKILAATETSVQDFFGLPKGNHAVDSAERTVPLLGEAHAGFGAPVAEGTERHAPSPGVAQIVSFPDRRYEPLYALSVSGNSMEPLYRDGDILFVAPNARAESGDRVVVKLEDDRLAVRILGRDTDGAMRFHPANPDHAETTAAAGRVEWMARIVYATQ